MPRGGARPGSGRPRKPIDHHVLAGTIRPARHGARLAVIAAAPVANSNEIKWQPTPADLEALHDVGRVFVAEYLDVYDVSPAEGRLLVELAHIADRLAEVRTLRVDPLGDPKERASLDRLEQGWLRLYASYASMLRQEVS